MLNMVVGTESLKDLLGITKQTVILMYNYEKGRLHGIFSGKDGEVFQKTAKKEAPFPYEVCTPKGHLTKGIQ